MLSNLVETLAAGVSTDTADLLVQLGRSLDDVLGVDLGDEGVLEKGRVFEQGGDLVMKKRKLSARAPVSESRSERTEGGGSSIRNR
jgi:hypothetical protein